MSKNWLTAALVAGGMSLPAPVAPGHPVTAPPTEAVPASFDIVETRIVTKGDKAVFATRVRGQAGQDKPAATARFEGTDAAYGARIAQALAAPIGDVAADTAGSGCADGVCAA